VRIAVLALLAAVVSSCSPLYVLRAGYVEAQILWRREPFERVLARPELPPDRRRKIELVIAAREYARAIGLDVDGSYTSLSHLDPDHGMWVLTAAKQTSLEAHTWWFPLVGEVPYKGFFGRERAEREAASLRREGYDTYVRPAGAFSTLGWFDDPLLAHLLAWDEVSLVSLVLHELYHNSFYVPGETAFNESLATFVGDRAAIDFFAGRPGDRGLVARAQAAWDDQLQFGALLGRLAERLRALYAAQSADQILARRAEVFAAAQAEYRSLGLKSAPAFAAQPLDNAVVLHYRLYGTDLDVFESVYRREGDLRRAIDAIEAAADTDREHPFDAVRRSLALPPGDDPADEADDPPPAAAGPPTPSRGAKADGFRSLAAVGPCYEARHSWPAHGRSSARASRSLSLRS
jgi:predicted aminopeptidase